MRRWCACEFFCSAIDRPWLMRNELADYLGHVGIPKAAKLSRPELAIIRASLGRPRRLSLNYLRQVKHLSSGTLLQHRCFKVKAVATKSSVRHALIGMLSAQNY